MVFVKTKCPANSRSLGPKLEVTTISKYCWTILPEIFYLNTKSPRDILRQYHIRKSLSYFEIIFKSTCQFSKIKLEILLAQPVLQLSFHHA